MPKKVTKKLNLSETSKWRIKKELEQDDIMIIENIVELEQF